MNGVVLLNISLLLATSMLLFEAVRRIPRTALQGTDASIWLALTLLILLGQQLTIILPDGATLGYLGAAFLALTLGYCRALVSMMIIVCVTQPWHQWATGFLIDAWLPVWSMCALVTTAHRHLPRNPFVFLLGCGFLGIFAVCSLQLLARAGWASLLGAANPHAGEQLVWSLMLAAGEATLEGMLITVLVVYCPRAVHLFHDADYWSRP